MKLSDNSYFVIIIFTFLKIRNIGRYKFHRSNFWTPPFNFLWLTWAFFIFEILYLLLLFFFASSLKAEQIICSAFAAVFFNWNANRRQCLSCCLSADIISINVIWGYASRVAIPRGKKVLLSIRFSTFFANFQYFIVKKVLDPILTNTFFHTESIILRFKAYTEKNNHSSC